AQGPGKGPVRGGRLGGGAGGDGAVPGLGGSFAEGNRPALARAGPGPPKGLRVRVLDTAHATGAVTRVLIDSTDGERSWSTIGVSENIIEASWQALSDSIVFGLLHNEGRDGAG